MQHGQYSPPTDDPGDTPMYTVDVTWCTEANVYVGTSEDIPGLTLEAGTKGELLDAVMQEVPHLIDHNIGVPEGEAAFVKVRFPESPVDRRAVAGLVGTHTVQRPRRYMVEDAYAASA